jgi:hypothetical protein
MIQLLEAYALDPMGDGQGLPAFVKANLPTELAKRRTAHVILAMVDGQPVGMVVCLEGFSTFACKPLLNFTMSSSPRPTEVKACPNGCSRKWKRSPWIWAAAN